MKISKKLLLILLAAVFAGTAYYVHHRHQYNTLISYRVAEKDFDQTKNLQLFERRKQLIADYYLGGQYDKDLQAITAKAKEHFSKLTPTPKDIIIFDVDDTVVYNYQKFDQFEFIWSKQPHLQNARTGHNSPAIKPVLALYNFLLEKKFKIILLTSRNEGQYQNTLKELENAGYKNFEKLMLMPDVLAFDRNIKTEDWKLDVRKKLSEQYSIIGCVGDREKDFFGGYCGYSVKLPNYLY